jgi:hypothetical protein
MGFSIVLYANTVLQAALRGAYAALGSLKKEGDFERRGRSFGLLRGTTALRGEA